VLCFERAEPLLQNLLQIPSEIPVDLQLCAFSQAQRRRLPGPSACVACLGATAESSGGSWETFPQRDAMLVAASIHRVSGHSFPAMTPLCTTSGENGRCRAARRCLLPVVVSPSYMSSGWSILFRPSNSGQQLLVLVQYSSMLLAKRTILTP